MKHVFNLSLSSDSSVVIPKVRALILESGGTFSGDSSCGSFSGSGVVGSYTTSGRDVTVTITKKPFLAPTKLVEAKIREYFSQL